LKKQQSYSIFNIRAVIIAGIIANVCLWLIIIAHYAAAAAIAQEVEEVLNKVYFEDGSTLTSTIMGLK
jgi:hypothetical protein